MNTTNTSYPTEIVFIDGALPDMDTLRAGVRDGMAVFVLDPLQDGIEQMARIASGFAGLSAIHVVSHGTAGSLQLGTTTMTASSLARYQTELSALGGALRAGGDLLLYGCDVAAGDIGQSFISDLALAMGADVAASTDLTGAAFLGGDWALEASTGAIEAASLAIVSYNAVLESPDVAGGYTTTSVLPLSGSVTGTIGTSGDQDWYTLSLTSGTQYLFLQDRTTGSPLDSLFRLLTPTYVSIFGSQFLNGATQVAADDDSGGNANSRLLYTATSNGLHFAAAGGYSSYTGDYILRALVVNTASTAGNDSISGTGNNEWLRGADGADTLTGNNGDDSLQGGNGNDLLNGNNGVDTLDGGAGADTMNGGDQNDTYYVDDAADVVSEFYNDATGGVDTVIASANHSLGNGIENLTLSLSANASVALTATGNTNNNVITGNYGDNTLQGGSGTDTLEGNYGNDVFIVDTATDTITDISGIDRIESSVDYYLFNAASVENLTLTGTAFYGYGNALANLIAGNASNNYLYSYEGNDTLIGDAGADTLIGAEGNDSMVGGVGDDSYYVDAAGDIVVELAGEGIDLVYSSAISYEISDADVENLTLFGYDEFSVISGTGNASANEIRGGDSANLLEGRGGADTVYGAFGDDTLFGNGGNDTLFGEAGNDSLDGGTGIDSLAGGAGDDTYVLDSASDVVLENASEGNDTLQIGQTFNLSTQVAHVENLTLTGSGNIDGTGNAQANYLRGNSGNNVLTGGAGADTLDGGAGNDTYHVDSYLDVTTESDSISGGNDTVYASEDHSLGNGIEHLVMTGIANYGGGNALANTLTGNAEGNSLQGNEGADTILGGGGADYIDGGAGADSMAGGADDDIVVVDNAGDIALENTGEGNDWIYAYIDFDLSATSGGHFENLYLLSGSFGYGSNADNYLYGNSGANYLFAYGGADTLFGGGGNDQLYGYAGNDSLDGSSGNDYMEGGLGNDTYVVDSVSDATYESDSSASGGVDTVRSSITLTIAVGIENLTLTGFTAISGTGNAAANLLLGNSGSNAMYGLAGADTLDGSNDAVADALYGGQDNDTYIVGIADTAVENANEGTDTVQSAGSWVLAANIENLILTGNAAVAATGNTQANLLTGNSGNNLLTGGDGNDTLDGGSGIDTLAGGLHNDTYLIDSTTDTITETNGGGTDSVQSSVSGYTLASEVENLVLTGSALSGTGNSLANALTGTSGNNTLDGAGGIDTLTGGMGDDTYAVDNNSDAVVEASGGGTDTVLSTATSYTLASEVESLVLSGSGNIAGGGNSGANNLTGNAGNNTLTGGAGADTMVGLAGNDTYGVDDAGDVVTEVSGGGTDTVVSSISYVLPTNVEHLTVTGSGELSLTGNSGANILTGNDGNNFFTTGGGNDTIDGGLGTGDKVRLTGLQSAWVTSVVGTVATLSNAGTGQQVTIQRAELLQYDNVDNVALVLGQTLIDVNDATGRVITGNTGNDSIFGLGGNDTLHGLAGDDSLDGGSGIDSMVGGSGNDIYLVDVSTDQVVEASNEGIDSVQSSATSYTLPAEVENLLLTGAGNIGGTGNGSANQVTGNSGNNALDGAAGDDSLLGLSGADNLIGGTGNDTLDGGTGNDTLVGGADNDTYYVDAASDTVSETLNAASGGGVDTVYSSVNFTLGTHIDNLVLLGTALNGIGNSLDNTITGNDSANFLDGMEGLDTLAGGAGNDTYQVDNAGDTIIEAVNGGATDRVNSTTSFVLSDNIEQLWLVDYFGATDAFSITGNALDNFMVANLGDNTIDGGAGADYMYGFSGNDVYVVDNIGDTVDDYVDPYTGGMDTVRSSIDYMLGDAIETLELTGTGAINGTGHAGANTLTGNSAGNMLSGQGGADTLDGGAGEDTLFGGDGDDLLIGGVGADVAVYDLGLSQYVLGVGASGVVTIRAISGFEGTDQLIDVEQAEFDGITINIGSGNQFGEQRAGSAFSAGSQTTPAVAALASGGQVLVWEHDNEILLQRYDALGAAAGSPVQVAQYGYDSDVTAMADGGFAVVYYGYDPGDSNGYGIRVKRFGADGGPTASLYLSSDNWDPSISGLSGGGLVVSWSAYNAGYDVKARTVDSNNTLGSIVTLSTIPAEGENPATDAGDQYYSSVTATSDGGFIAAWYGDGAVHERRFDAAGQVAVINGNPAPLVTSSDSFGYQPVVVALADGGHVTLWQGNDAYWNGVIGQRFDSSGERVGENFPVNTTVDLDQGMPSAAALADGGFVVVWESEGQDGEDYGIFGQRFSASGLTLGDEFQVNASTAYGQRTPDVAASAFGFVVTWRSEAGSGGVFSQRFGLEGNKIGGLAVTGSAGDDLLDAGDALQSVSMDGAAGNDVLMGGMASDTLAGGAGNDTLVGGGGDLLEGGQGDDVYLISADTDTVAEDDDEGLDQVRTTLAEFTLPETAVEDLVLLGSAVTGVGNEHNNTLVGNFAANILIGAGGDDTLRGGYGTDQARFQNELGEYVFGVDTAGSITLRHTVVGGDGTDTLDAIQIARFGNTTYNIGIGTLPGVDTAVLANTSYREFDQTKAAGLPGGGALVVTITYDANNNYRQVVVARQLDANGNMVGSDVPLGMDPANGSINYQSLRLAAYDGGFAVAWISRHDPDINDPNNAWLSAPVARFLAPDGTPTGAAPVNLVPLSTDYLNPPTLATLDTGELVVYQPRAFNGTIYPLDALRYDASGSLASSATLNIGYAGNGLAVTPDGTLLKLIYKTQVTPQGNTERWFNMQRYTDAGAAVGAEVQLTNKSALQTGIEDVRAVAIGNGNHAVVWQRGNGTDTDIAAQVYNSAWTPLFASQITPTGETVFDQAQLDVAALAGGGFVVAWTNTVLSTGQSDVYARVYNANGVATGIAPVLVHTSAAGIQNRPSIIAEDDGSFSILYTQNSGYLFSQHYDADGRRIGGLDLTGGANADKLRAIDAQQVVSIKGLGGNDTLTGGAANDTLDGGAGNDELHGGAGVDSLIGGANNDTYHFDGTADIFVEQEAQGTDTVLASASYTLPSSSIENVILVDIPNPSDPTAPNAAENFDATGNSRANTLIGNKGNNQLDGRGGNDSMAGGAGDDIYFVDSTGDVVTEGPAGGLDTIFSSVSNGGVDLAAHVENLVLTGSDPLAGRGNNLPNLLTGNAGANALIGRGGDDTYEIDGTDTVTEDSGGGNDTIRIGASYTLVQIEVENLVLTGIDNFDGTGNGGNNQITGNSANNLLTGGGGNDTLSGDGGTDTLAGGLGDDMLEVDSTDDVVQEAVGEGTADTVVAWVSYALPTGALGEIERLVLAGTTSIDGHGNALDNRLTGNAGNNLLDGGAGADNMAGGSGDDTYHVDAAGDLVTESLNQGIDTIRSLVTITALTSHVENLVLLGNDSIDGTGNDFDNVLTGNDQVIDPADGLPYADKTGNNILDGRAGADTMAGGSGNDTYVVDNVGDLVSELGDQGIDTVRTSLTQYTLPQNVERLELTGTTALNATGNDAGNTIYGNTLNNVIDGGSGADSMYGGKGDDFYYVDSAGDQVYEVAGEGSDTVFTTLASYILLRNVENLTLLDIGDTTVPGANDFNGTGNFLSNIIQGNRGNNAIDGGQFVDVLIGAGGNDTYFVDTADDLVVEYADEGTDSIYSTVTYTLPDWVENLNLNTSATSPLIANTDAIGNVLANLLTGNGGNNLLSGKEDNDTLNGGAGNDTLDGGTGADVMTGNAGDDTYLVDDVGDTITEALNEGADTVQSSLSYTLGIHVENLQLLGMAHLLGTGNSLSNQLIGNDSNNLLTALDGDDLLKGGIGNDTMVGGIGNDIYYVDNNADVVTEALNQGTDVVYVSSPGTGVNQTPLNGYALPANVENVIYFDPNLLFVVGNGLNNYFTGNDGNNTLDGAGGADTMEGGVGNDTYKVDNAGDTVVENGGEGINDVVEASVSYALSDNVENLVLVGSAEQGTGNGGHNTMTGNAANNLLDGGAGNDSMAGGAGNDTYRVDASGDVVDESGGDGIDMIVALVDLTLPQEVENLELDGLNNLTGDGNELDNTIIGNNGNNVINGGDGEDTASYSKANGGVIVNLGTGQTSGGGGTDILNDIEGVEGSVHGDSLTGSNGDNTLNGAAGRDTMAGGFGDDTYYVDDPLDQVVETNNNAAPGAPAGVDLNVNLDTVVASTLAYTLGAFLENLVQAGVANATGVGNELPNALTGNDGNNLLQGLGGDDTLNGGSGNDTLSGGQGNDTLTGGLGTDTADYSATTGALLVNLTTTISQLVSASEGSDTLTEIENLTGGAFADSLTGDRFNNHLLGLNGDDFMSGLDGFDSLEGGDGNDNLNGGVNADTLIGGLGNDTLAGGKGTDVMEGGDGIDSLIGGLGTDLLTGGAGADRFSFRNLLDGTINIDTITDFAPGVDTIELSASIFGAFAGQIGSTIGTNANLSYSNVTGAIAYDADGAGAGASMNFAILGSVTHPATLGNSFLIVA